MRVRHLVFLASILGPAIGFAFACNSTHPVVDAGADGGDAASDAAPEAACSWFDQCIQPCVAARCCAALNACAPNPDCRAWNACESACSFDAGPARDSGSCREDCVNAHPEGAQISKAGTDCVTSCFDSCAP